MDSGKVAHRRKPDIPVIRSRASDENQQVSAKRLELGMVIRLLEDPLTADLKERHLFVLKKLLKRNQIGFLLKELKGIAKILNICAEKVKDHPEYVPVLCEALNICSLPFLKEKASDELTYAQDVIEFLSHMGCLMRVSDAEVRQQIVESVKSFYSCVAPKQLLDGTDPLFKTKPRTFSSDNRFSRLSLRLQPASPGYRLQLLERSDLPQTLLLSMAALENQPAIRLQLLQTLQILSSSSDLNCVLILNARGAEMICLHMNEPDPSCQVLFRSSEILWNLLERGNKEEVTAQLSSMECVLSLKEAFLTGLGHSDHQLTNELLVIVALIAENPNSLLIESSFAKDLVVLATFPELKTVNALVRNLKLNFSTEDFKMKKLLLNLLVSLSRDFAALQLFEEERVMPALLTLMKPPTSPSERRSGSRHWSSAQQEELQLQALTILATIAPLMVEEYVSCQGIACLLLLLDWCVRKDALFGPSSHGTGGGGSKTAQMFHCVRVLRSVTSLCVDSVNQDLCDQGIINQLLGILMQMEASPDEEDVITLEIKLDIQLILSLLCESDMHRKELFGSEGVEMVLHFLRKGSDRFYSGLGHNKLILSTVDCVWSCIVGCYTTEDYFLAKEGVSLLLELLSSSPRCVHCNILATLLELCDNPNALPHVLSWRDDRGRTAPGLLLQLWREEEEELQVSRNQHGGIADPQRPLLSLQQQDDTKLSFPVDVPSPAVLELSENLRSKIYSILCRIGFHDLPGLSAKHYVTLSIVRRYLDFKVGEVWEEINRELSLDGVRPISPDEEALSTICKITEDTARRVAAEQNSILEQREKEELGEEKLMYTEMKSHWKQRELMAKSWDSYVSKTSNYEILKEVKAQRESSRPKPKHEGAAVHPTEHFIGQVMAAESTDAQGSAGVKLMLTRAPIKTAGQDAVGATTQDPEYFSTVSVKD
ncbi:cilia- and flagella-associated protein 69 isoform X1 [Sparus aurata]|uniref:cilia- and flagella-associated protein 69 isoform X1 n=1 Tax=Sparus aurata TaxID=8175 RepID=UPI0011C1172A|nr:cilia- and flagella-associated protein 69 isoform X1 [Sparus aurata]XP_030267531.1 cilia- and flagella-associated protein 69 isoform X1 [Sparus aurata]